MEVSKKSFLEWSVKMRIRSATTGLIIEASCVLQETVAVLSEHDHGAAMRALGTASRRVTSCRTRAPLGLVDNTNSAVTYADQEFCQTRL